MSGIPAKVKRDAAEAGEALGAISEKEMLFVSFYCFNDKCFGNAQESARAAGYTEHASRHGFKILARPHVRAAVFEAIQSSPRICGLGERVEIRSTIARDSEDDRARLAALNDLDKAFGAIETMNLRVSGGLGLAHMSSDELRKLALSSTATLLEEDTDDTD